MDILDIDVMLPWMDAFEPEATDNLARYIFDAMKPVLDEDDAPLCKRLEKRFLCE